jgi:hypothetical protein
MTEQKKLQEQMALHDYWSKTEEIDPQENEREKRTIARVLPRVVKIPEADPSMAWKTFKQRQQERQQARPTRSQRRQTVLVPRTLGQTGTPASSGRMRAVRRTISHRSSPIPPRRSRRPVRRGLLWKLLSIFVGGALVILLGSFILTGSAFRIALVNVEGSKNAGLVSSIQQLGIQGQNIFLLDVTGFTERVESLPLVASVELRKQLPNRLTIQVKERQPVILWQVGKDTFAVDSQGMILAPAAALSSTESNGENLSTVIDVSTRQGTGKQNGKNSGKNILPVLQPGAHLEGADIVFAQDIMRRLPPLVGVSTFKLYYDGTMDTDTNNSGGKGLDSRGSFIIESPGGWKAYLGGSADTNPLENRLIELREILALTQQQQLDVATIDLRYGLRPTFTIKK